MTLQVGENVGAYRVIEQLGQGGMATVFKAYHPALDRYVAIKVLHAAFKADPTFLARFQREARVVASLEHPHIIPVYDFADHNGAPYLVMKFIEGETLKAVLTRQPITTAEVWRVVEAVGAGLDYAHKKGILHRDIKPSNVMLASDGGIYIADFGLARIALAGESTLSMDSMLGTPHYMSPEQAKGIKDLTASADIYSFGVMIYEMLVGRVPYNADTPFAIIHDHIFTPLPTPRSLNPDFPESLERFLLKALAKEREDRYKDVNEMVLAFREAVTPLLGDEAAATLAQLRPTATSPSAITAAASSTSSTAKPAAPTVALPATPSAAATVAQPRTPIPAQRGSGFQWWHGVVALGLMALGMGGALLGQRIISDLQAPALTLTALMLTPAGLTTPTVEARASPLPFETLSPPSGSPLPPNTPRPPEGEATIDPAAETLLQQADNAFNNDNADAALKLLDEATEVQPDNLELKVRAGDLTLKHNLPGEALAKFYLPVVARVPDFFESRFIPARSHINLAFYMAAALADGQTLIADKAKNYPDTAIINAAALRWQIFHQNDAALEAQVENYLDNNEDSPEALMLAGDYHLALGDFEEAMDYYDEILALPDRDLVAKEWIKREASCKRDRLAAPNAKLELTMTCDRVEELLRPPR